jgi:hypothetical protein
VLVTIGDGHINKRLAGFAGRLNFPTQSRPLAKGGVESTPGLPGVPQRILYSIVRKKGN